MGAEDTVKACQAPLDRTISCFVGVKKITIPSGGDNVLIEAVSVIRASNNPWFVEFNSSNADFWIVYGFDPNFSCWE